MLVPEKIIQHFLSAKLLSGLHGNISNKSSETFCELIHAWKDLRFIIALSQTAREII